MYPVAWPSPVTRPSLSVGVTTRTAPTHTMKPSQLPFSAARGAVGGIFTGECAENDHEEDEDGGAAGGRCMGASETARLIRDGVRHTPMPQPIAVRPAPLRFQHTASRPKDEPILPGDRSALMAPARCPLDPATEPSEPSTGRRTWPGACSPSPTRPKVRRSPSDQARRRS